MRHRWLLRAYPRAWRDRYGEEILDLLAASDRPVLAAIDVLATGIRIRIEGDGMIRTAAVLAVLGLVWAAWAIPQLASGVLELPGHWWSAPSLLLLAGGAGLATAALVRRRRGRV